MKIKSELQVFNQAGEPETPGVIPGLTVKKLAGCADHPAERISSVPNAKIQITWNCGRPKPPPP